MGVFNGMFPIAEGKEDAARKFAAEAIGARKADFAAHPRTIEQHSRNMGDTANPNGELHADLVRR